MNLSAIPDSVWLELAQSASWSARARQRVRTEVHNHFARHIYRVWPHSFEYRNNHSGGPDVGWVNAVFEWQSVAEDQSIAHALGDHSAGFAALQDDPDNPYIGTRIGEMYAFREKDRVQFLVLRGGGLVLFNRMRRACQNYVASFGRHQDVLMSWKVWGEDVTRSRSHCCVIYLGRRFDDPSVEYAFRAFIYPQVRDLIDHSNHEPVGMYRLSNLPFWAMRMPSSQREQQVLAETSGGSAEKLMGVVLGRAFEQAATAVDPNNLRALADAAKRVAQELVSRLYQR